MDVVTLLADRLQLHDAAAAIMRAPPAQRLVDDDASEVLRALRLMRRIFLVFVHRKIAELIWLRLH